MGSKRFEILFDSAVDTSTAQKNVQEIQKLFEKTELEITPSYDQSVFTQVQKNLKTLIDESTKLKTIQSTFTQGGVDYNISQSQAFSSNGSKYWQSAQIQYADQQQAVKAGLEELKVSYQTLTTLQNNLTKAVSAGDKVIEDEYKSLIDFVTTQTQSLETALSKMGGDTSSAQIEKVRNAFRSSQIATELEREKKATAESSKALSEYVRLLKNRNQAEVALRRTNLELTKATGSERTALLEVKQGLEETIDAYQVKMNAVKQNITAGKDLIELDHQEAVAQGQLKTLIGQTNKAFAEQKSWSDKIVDAFKSQLGTLSTFALVQKAFQAITWAGTQAVTSIKDLDKAMTDIQIVTTGTASETQALFEQYNALAKLLGNTTANIAAGASSWLRQGRSPEDTAMLIEQSSIFSKVGNLEAEEATEKLTAVLNGFKMTAQEASHVVDALSMVDLKAATSTGELAEALQYTSNSARVAGVDFEELVGMIAAVSESTRLSASIVGNSFKTLFARFSNIAAGKTIDDFGESINDVETVLRGVGIEIREDAGNFREAMDVFEEVAEQWNRFNDTERNQISTAIAGTRQREMWNALMENWQRAKDLMDVATNSTGASSEKFNIYLDSIEARTNKLKATFEGFVKSEATTNLFKGAISAATTFLEIIEDIANSPAIGVLLAGGLYAAIGKVVPMLSGLIVTLQGVEFSIAGVTAAFAASPFAIIVAVTAGVYALSKGLEYLTEETERYYEALEKTQSTIYDRESTIAALEARNDLSDAEKEYLALLKEEVEVLKEREKIESERANASKLEDIFTEFEQALDAYKSEAAYIDSLASQDWTDNEETGIMKMSDAMDKLEEYRSMLQTAANELKELQDSGFDVGSYGEYMISTLEEIGITAQVTSDSIVDLSDRFDEEGNAINSLNEELEETEESVANIVAEFQHLSETLVQIDDVQAEIDKNGLISLDTLDKLIDKYPQLTEQVNLYLLGLASTEDIMSALQEAYAVDEQNAYNNIVAKLKMNEEYYTYLKQLDADLVRQFAEDYGIDLDNHVTYDEGKEAIETTLVNKFNEMWAEHFGLVGEGFGSMEDALKALGNVEGNAFLDAGQQAAVNKLSHLADTYKSAMKDWESVYDNSFVINLTNQYTALGDSARQAAAAARDASNASSRAAQQAAKQQEDYYNKLLELTVAMLRKEKELEKQHLKDQLEGYKKLIDAQEKLLEKQDEQYYHDRELQDKNKTISQLEGQIAELQFDTSAEGVKKRLLLEEELAEKKRDLEDYQHDYSIDQQKDALKEEEERYTDFINDQIDEIDRWLNETGKIYAEARRLIEEHADATLQRLLEYNAIYGKNLQEEVILWWNGATAAVYQYENALNSAAVAAQRLASYTGGSSGVAGPSATPSSPSKGTSTSTTKNTTGQTTTGSKGTSTASKNVSVTASGGSGGAYSTYRVAVKHKGIDAGFVGNLKGNEEFVKALKGEVFVTKAQQDKFMQKILPNMAKNGRSNVQNSPSNVNFKTLLELTVNGNMNKDMLPELEQIVQKAVKELNKTMFMSGNVKSTRSVSI